MTMSTTRIWLRINRTAVPESRKKRKSQLMSEMTLINEKISGHELLIKKTMSHLQTVGEVSILFAGALAAAARTAPELIHTYAQAHGLGVLSLPEIGSGNSVIIYTRPVQCVYNSARRASSSNPEQYTISMPGAIHSIEPQQGGRCCDHNNRAKQRSSARVKLRRRALCPSRGNEVDYTSPAD
ncbi:unnamed protein product [Trichogramma brassicae]|uniref:Uncharacterized protein n=1 Tax=Trichogramma brassicae TaxID=86971 RepID=A0A6H5I883_9HYME|nr:unnamed protein product [Trichogramma brassicae]